MKSRILILFLLLANASWAGDGRFEISQSVIPLTITNPGSYILTANITGVAGTNAITVAASGVTIDLNGFALSGVAGSLDGVNAVSNGFSDIVVRNGIARGWGDDGIDLFSVSNTVVADIISMNNVNGGINAGWNSRLDRCLIYNNGGVHFPAATNGAGNGLRVENGSQVRDCLIWENSHHGLFPNSAGLADNLVMVENGHDGYHGSHASVIRGSLSSLNNEGIQVDSAGEVVDCVTYNNVEDGIRAEPASDIFYSGSFVQGCVISANSDNGVDMRGPGQVVSCLSFSNVDHGIRLFTNCVAVGNLVAVSTGGDSFKFGEGGNRGERNHAYGSSGDGFDISGFYPDSILLQNSGVGKVGNDYNMGTNNMNNGYVTNLLGTASGSLPIAPWVNFDF